MDILQIISTQIENWSHVISYSSIAAILAYIIHSLLLGRVFNKAGSKYWQAWVPVVRDWTFFTVGKYHGTNVFWFLGAIFAYLIAFLFAIFDLAPLAMISLAIGLALFIVGICFKIAAVVSIQKKFGKPLPFVILYFINIAAPLWLWILALGHSKYSAKKGHQLKK